MKEQKFYAKKWFCILTLIFFAPVGIFLLWKYKHFSPTVSKILAAASVIFFIYALVMAPSNEFDTDTNNDVSVKTTKEVKKNTETPTETIETTTTTPAENDVSPSKNNVQIVETDNQDLMLITKTNHPTLFSATDSAHEFWGEKKGILGWKDREDKKISYPDTTTNSSDSGINWDPCILDMKGDMNFANCYNDYIFEIQINFENFEKPIKLNLEKALELASDYLPHETLKTYYKHEHSTSYKATKASQLNDCYYDISYSPIKQDAHNFILNNTSYAFPNIYVTLLEDADKSISYIWINLYQSICTSGRNSIAYGKDYKEISWNYDFLTK